MRVIRHYEVLIALEVPHSIQSYLLLLRSQLDPQWWLGHYLFLLGHLRLADLTHLTELKFRLFEAKSLLFVGFCSLNRLLELLNGL
jgi:hypothetical protein